MLNGKVLKSLFLIIFLFCEVNLFCQNDTTINYTKAEFAKIKYVKQALKNFPKGCKILSYEISMFMVNGVKTKTYEFDKPDSSTQLFFEYAAKNGGEMTIRKIKTSCPSSSHKSKYKIVVE